MQKKPTQVPSSIRQSKETLKSCHKKPFTPVSHPIPISNSKKRTNSSYIENSNKKKLEEAGYSHKKHNSNSSFKNNKHKIFQVEHIIPLAVKQTKNHNTSKVYSVITESHNPPTSISKNKIRKNFKKNNDSLGEIGCCKKLIIEKPKAVSTYERKTRKVHLGNQSPEIKQDNIKTDLDENIIVKEKDQNIKKQHKQSKTVGNEPAESIPKSISKNIKAQDLSQLDKMTSNQISQLQSRSQTIDLLKFTIKTKLQKDIFSESPHKLNSLLSSENKAPQSKYIEEIMRLKELQTNFYVEKITTLQNQLNRYRKQSERQEKQGKAKWQEESRQILVEKTRLQDQNALLKRENQALRTIIMKKLKPNSNKPKLSEPLTVTLQKIDEY